MPSKKRVQGARKSSFLLAEEAARGKYPVTEAMIQRTIRHGYKHRIGYATEEELRRDAIHTYQPVWSMFEGLPEANGGYLQAFEGHYTPFSGALTQAKVMQALYEQLKAIGGADHRYVEDVYQKGSHKGKPIYLIGTGS